MNTLQIIATFLGAGALTGIGGAAWHLGLGAWEHLESVRTRVAQQKHERKQLELLLKTGQLNLERESIRLNKERLAITELVHQKDGLYPLLWDGLTILDPNRGIVLSHSGVESITPQITVPEQKRRMLQAMAGLNTQTTKTAIENESSQEIDLPSRVPATWALQELGKPSFSNLALGVAMQNGQPELVRGDLTKMVHVATGGSSGSGKSVFARFLAYQLAIAGDCSLAMVDLEYSTFAPFENCSNLLYPVADSENDALAVFDALLGEMEKRKEMYSRYPGVDSLPTYNSMSDEKLQPAICLVDESTALLGNKKVEKSLKTLALRARKYGLWLILLGQDWRGASLDISIRNQLSARFSFKTMSKSQSYVLLGCNDAYDLPADKPGRAVAILPGMEKTVMQCPMVTRDDILNTLTTGQPKFAMPEPQPNEDAQQAELIRELHEQGLSKREIQKRIFGYCGGAAFNAVDNALSGNGTE
jgi:hypothetical protein